MFFSPEWWQASLNDGRSKLTLPSLLGREKGRIWGRGLDQRAFPLSLLSSSRALEAELGHMGGTEGMAVLQWANI